MAAVYGLSTIGMKWQNAVYSVQGYEATENYFDLLGARATCIPARRALSVNPSTLMREE